MKSLLFSLALTFTFLSGQAQVRAVYHTTYSGISGDSLDQEPHGELVVYNEYIIDEGKYAYIVDAGPEWISSYDSRTNRITTLDIEGNLTQKNAAKSDNKLIDLQKSDSVFHYKGYKAFLIIGQDETGTYESIYTVDEYFDPHDFRKHGFANWNEELKITGGRMLLRSERKMQGMTMVMEVVSLEHVKSGEFGFDIDNLAKTLGERFRKQTNELRKGKKRLNEMLRQSSSVQSFHISGKIEPVGQHIALNFPFELTYQEPGLAKMHMSLMNYDIIFLSNGKDRIIYNPFEGKPRRVPIESDKGSNYLVLTNVFDAHTLPQEAIIRYVNDVEVDSLTLRRVVYHLPNKKTLVRFYSIQTGFNQLAVQGASVNWFLNYRSYHGHIFPSLLISREHDLRMHVEDYIVNPDFPEGHFELPDSLLAQVIDVTSNPQSAEDSFNQAERLMASHDQQDSLERAIVSYKEAIKLDPENDLYHNQLGNAYYYQEDYYSALVNYKLAVDYNPENSVAWLNLSSVKYELDNFEAALKDINMSISLEPYDADALAKRGDIEYALDETRKSLADYVRAYKLRPSDVTFASKAGYIYYELNVYDSSLYYLNKADSLGTMESYYRNYRGLAFYNRGQYEDALAEFERVMREAPSMANVPYNRAYTLNTLGRTEEAILAYQQILESDPANTGVMNNLGMIYYQEEDYNQAIPYFRQAIAVNDTEASFYDNLGNSYFKLMNYSEAIEAYDKSINLYPDDPVIYYRRGMAKIQISNKFDGCKDLKQAKDSDLEDAVEAFEENCTFLKN